MSNTTLENYAFIMLYHYYIAFIFAVIVNMTHVSVLKCKSCSIQSQVLVLCMGILFFSL